MPAALEVSSEVDWVSYYVVSYSEIALAALSSRQSLSDLVRKLPLRASRDRGFLYGLFLELDRHGCDLPSPALEVLSQAAFAAVVA